jgi:hypothetical protein
MKKIYNRVARVCLLGDESGLAEDCQKNSQIQCCTPEPMARIIARCLLQVTPEKDD